jgi:hypothetical protein
MKELGNGEHVVALYLQGISHGCLEKNLLD